MSEQIIRRSGMAVDMQSTLPWLVAAGAYMLLLALGPRLLSDPDTYSHIALGAGFSITTPFRPPTRFRQTFAGHIGSPSSGSRKSHLQEHMPLEVGLALSH